MPSDLSGTSLSALMLARGKDWIFTVQREIPTDSLKPKVNRKEGEERNEGKAVVALGIGRLPAKKSPPPLNISSPRTFEIKGTVKNQGLQEGGRDGQMKRQRLPV